MENAMENLQIKLLVLVMAMLTGTAQAALVGHWTLDDALGSLIAVDSSGQGHDGAVGAGVTLGQLGVAGTAGDFNGGAGINANMGIDWVTGDEARTITSWFNADTFGGNQRGIFGNGAQTGNFTRFDINTENVSGNESIMFRYQGGNIAWSGNAELGGLNTGELYHLAVVVPDNATFDDVDVYINGVLLTADGGNFANSGTSLNTTGNMIIGDTGGNFDGLIDDVQYYNEALSGADIVRLFENPGVALADIGDVPEPATATLALLGLGGLVMRRRRNAA